MEEIARIFRALGDETRLKLLAELRRGERTVGELVTALDVPQPKVSRHLRILKDAGLVQDHKVGRHVRYGLCQEPGASDVRSWIGWLAAASGPSGPPPKVSAPRRKDDLDTHLL